MRLALALVIGLAVVPGCRPPGADGNAADANRNGPDADRRDAAETSDAAYAADARVATTARIATANLRCLIEDWDARLALISSEVAALSADYVVLQEVCRIPGGRDALGELVDAIENVSGLRYHALRATTHTAWDTYEEGIAILSRRTPLQELVLDLPPGTFPRKAVLLRGQGIVVAGTHLSFGADNATVRRAQLSAVRAKLDQLRQPGDAAVVAGDFNETDDGLAIGDTSIDGYVDAWEVAHPGEPGATVPSDDPSARIDYVWVNGATPNAAELFMDASVDGVWPSDHRGLWADVPLR